MTVTYLPLTKENRSIDMEFDYSVLEDKLDIIRNKVVTRNEEGEVIRELDYYEKRRNEISFEWLNGIIVTPEQGYIWHANMPLPLCTCRDLYEAAMRGLPKKAVISLVLPDYDMDANESQLFEVVYSYGQAKGLMVVAEELFEGAKHGDPRAVKMYLEISGLLAVSAEDADAAARKKMMRISFDM